MGSTTRKGSPFALLDTAGRSQIIIPKELMRWLVGQPDDVLNSRKAIETRFAISYLSPPVSKRLDDAISLAIRRDLTRNLGRTQKVVFDTLRERADTVMGQDESWHEVNLGGVIQSVVSSVSYRMLVGEALYENKTFLKST